MTCRPRCACTDSSRAPTRSNTVTERRLRLRRKERMSIHLGPFLSASKGALSAPTIDRVIRTLWIPPRFAGSSESHRRGPAISGAAGPERQRPIRTLAQAGSAARSTAGRGPPVDAAHGRLLGAAASAGRDLDHLYLDHELLDRLGQRQHLESGDARRGLGEAAAVLHSARNDRMVCVTAARRSAMQGRRQQGRGS